MVTSYIEKLDHLLKTKIEDLSQQIKGDKNPQAKTPPMPQMLMSALKNEWETSLLTSHWVIDESNADLRIGLARLIGDEAKHFSLIEKRLVDLGGKKNVDELNKRSPLFQYLLQQKTTFDRVITGPYARESLAVARNKIFLEYCEKIKDQETITIYETIQADEIHHHQLGRNFLSEMVRSESDFLHAQNKISEILSVVDEIQEMIVMKMGLCRLPGC